MYNKNLKKVLIPLAGLTLMAGLFGCSTEKSKVDTPVKEPVTNEQVDKGNGNKLDGSVAEDKIGTTDVIFTNIKEKMNEFYIGEGDTDLLVDGDFVHLDEVDLTSDDGNSDIILERLGLDKSDFSEGIFLFSMMNVKSDEVILLKAKDESGLEKLKEALKKERDAQYDTWKQYLPDQFEKVENNIISTKGNYIMYVTFDTAEEIIQVFENSVE